LFSGGFSILVLAFLFEGLKGASDNVRAWHRLIMTQDTELGKEIVALAQEKTPLHEHRGHRSPRRGLARDGEKVQNGGSLAKVNHLLPIPGRLLAFVRDECERLL
jgi:hypothetical protein